MGVPFQQRQFEPELEAEFVARTEHAALVDDLHRRYGRSGSYGLKTRTKYLIKTWLWRSVITGSLVLKRMIDLAVAAAMLILLSPLFIVVACLIKLTDGGSILFWQKRVGQWGKEFSFPKFRSMVANAEELKKSLHAQNSHQTGVTFKMRRDPRVTPIGRIIRKLSIDELPQLWCVLAGKLSLVGPRPPLPSEVARYTTLDRRRLEVKPGLTCIWQVSGRADIPFHKQVELDVQYIHSQSLTLDLVLVLKTVPAVLTGRGSY